jgi:prepilin peptidase CpaA
MSSASAYLQLIAVLGCAIAAVIDQRTRTIPNQLTLGLLGVGVVARALLQGGSAGLLALASALMCAAVPLFLFVRGALGGGDVKLFAALGALLGLSPALEIELASFALVAAYGVAHMFLAGRLVAFLRASLQASAALVGLRPAADGSAEAALALPMGAAIFVATGAVLVREALP